MLRGIKGGYLTVLEVIMNILKFNPETTPIASRNKWTYDLPATPLPPLKKKKKITTTKNDNANHQRQISER